MLLILSSHVQGTACAQAERFQEIQLLEYFYTECHPNETGENILLRLLCQTRYSQER